MVSRASADVTITLATDADEQAWDAFVASHPAASGYHRWPWRAVFERVFGHEGAYLVARRGSEIAGILPLVLFRTTVFGRFAVSLPFVNYGGVVANSPAVARALLDRAVELAEHRRLGHVELRHRDAVFPELPSKRHKVAMSMELPLDAATAWSTLDRKVRNQIRKAEKSGLSVRVGGAELLDAFYDVFARNMRDLGTPVYDRRFFGEVLRQFPCETRVFVVYLEAECVAAGISYRHRDTLEFPWASSLKEHRPLCPNVLLYWHVIQFAIQQGARTFDFGRSTPNEGTYKFKEQWGAQPQPVCWEYRLVRRANVPDMTPKNPAFNPAIAIWKHLPLGLTRLLGPHIVRAIP